MYEQLPPGYERQDDDPYQAYRRQASPGRGTRFSFDRALRLFLGLLTAGAVAWVLWYFANLVIYLVIGVLLSYVMRPVVDRLQGLGLGRISAILVTFVLVFGTLTVLLTELAPFTARQLSDLSEQLSLDRAAQVVRVEAGRQTARPALSAGDLVVGVDGKPWQGYEQLEALIEAKQPGEQVLLHVEGQDGARRTVYVMVRPVAAPGEGLPAPPEDDGPLRVEALGLTVREVAVSEAAEAIERRIRDVLPVEKGSLLRGIYTSIDRLFQEERITEFAGSLVGLFTDLFYAVIVIPFVAFFGLKDGMRIRHALLGFVPNRYFEITLAIVEKIEAIIGRYFKAILVQGMAVALVASLLLSVVGLKYAVAVGVFTGLANTIPYFGPFMGFLAGALVGVLQTGDFSLVPGVLVAMALTQVTDNVFFQPFLFSRAAQMHPLVILFAVLMGAQLGGIVGMLVAIPVTTIVRVIIEQVLWSLRNYRILQNV